MKKCIAIVLSSILVSAVISPVGAAETGGNEPARYEVRSPGLTLKLSADGRIVGCGALEITWENLGEIRSVAVVAEFQRRGLGRRLVEACLAEARRLARESSVPGLRREVEKALLRWRGEES
jgi:ribosomal protein S18 acetylase RimI-like enzyme